MLKVFIKYDPYEMKSTVKVNGAEIQKSKSGDPHLKKFLDSKIHIPIQSWIDPIDRDGWKGLLGVLCDMNDKDITVEFSGRAMDYESVKKSLNAQNESGKYGAALTFCELTEEIIPDVKMKENIDIVIKLMLTDEFKKIVGESQSKDLLDKYEHLQGIYDEIKLEEFRVVFTGTYSSGKSSTINVLLGKNLLPTASGTCTAKICRIIHSHVSEGLAKVAYLAKGRKKEYICQTDEEVQEKIKGAEEAVETIEVYTDLSRLYPSGIEKDFKLVIIDTPGTDSATGNDTKKAREEAKRLSKKSHIDITKEILQSKKKEMVVLISDNRLEGDNIVKLLDIIEESSEQDGGAFNDRFLFVMNMCDSLRYSNKGETLSNYIKNFIGNIKKIPNSSQIRNIVNPRVFPVASGAALAIVNGFTDEPDMMEGGSKKAELYDYYEAFCKKIYHYDPTKLNSDFEQKIEQIKAGYSNYFNYCLEQESSISEALRCEYMKKLDGVLSVPERVLIHSGVPALEDAIREYIRSYAFPIKVRRLLNCFTDILCELDNLNKTEEDLLEAAKKKCSSVGSLRQEKEKEEWEKEKRKNRLQSVKGHMAHASKKIDKIKEIVPEINELQASRYLMSNSILEIAEKQKEVLKGNEEAIIDKFVRMVEEMQGKIEGVVRGLKKQKRKETEECYDEFVSYLNELDKEGLMQNEGFSLQDTVAYRKLIDREDFAKPVEVTRTEKNPDKEYIEFEYGIGNFFASIGRAWKTRKESETIRNTYINIEKYISENIASVQVEIDNYIEKIRENYKNDIVNLKKDTKKRMDRVVTLIEQKDLELDGIRSDVYKIAADEKQYKLQIEKLEHDKAYLGMLMSKLEYTQV